MKVVVVDYGSGNLRSAAKALELASAEISGQFEITVTGDAADVEQGRTILSCRVSVLLVTVLPVL